jgi:hypothetical protein
MVRVRSWRRPALRRSARQRVLASTYAASICSFTARELKYSLTWLAEVLGAKWDGFAW